jgi:hypothetical protein
MGDIPIILNELIDCDLESGRVFLGIRKLADTPRRWLTKAEKKMSGVGELLRGTAF